MATQDVDFKVGNGLTTNDSGNPGTDYPDEAAGIASIKNLAPGERVRAVVFNRPLENLRKRTETLKVETETQKYLQDTDMRWIITGGTAAGLVAGNSQPAVIWVPGDNKFSTSADIVLQPIAGPKTDKKSSITYTKAPDWIITLGTDLYRFQEGHKLSIRWQEAAPGTLPLRVTTEVLFEPYPTLVITLCNDGTTLVSDVHTALNTLGGSAGFTHSVSGTGYVLLADIMVDGLVNPLYTFATTYDRELHHIPAATFAAFFATESILSGDTLCLGYEWLVNPDGVTYSGRRQSTESSGTSTVSLPGQLFLADAYPDRLPLAIPICKRIGDDLLFIDGTLARGDEGSDVYFGMNGYTTKAFTATTAPSGASFIGVSANTHASGHKSADVFDLAAGTLQATLVLFQTFINDKASLDAAELVEGEWLFGDTVYTYDPMFTFLTYGIQLVWRTGHVSALRPSNAQIGWNTISRYGIFFQNEVFHLTIQGGYIEYYVDRFVIHTPGTGTGNVYVNIDSVGSPTGYAANHNIRGSRRLYNATANTRYDLFPSNWFTDSLSGDIYYEDIRTMWATALNWVTTTATLIATDQVTTVSTMSYTRISESVTSGSAMAIHPAPTLTVVSTNILGADKHSFFNRVLEGFATVPATVVDMGGGLGYSAGQFAIDQIQVMGGRAIVVGKIITIPEIRTMSNVVNNYRLPNTSLPSAATNKMKWYGLWLRVDGVYRIGPLPQYNLGVGIPGSTQYMVPLTSVETTFDQHDYTLINLVWSYQGNSAGAIRFAGIMHMGGNVWMYHQALRGDFTVSPTWTSYVDHRFCELRVDSAIANVDVLDSYFTGSNAITGHSAGLPGVPAAIASVAILNTRMDAHLEASGDYARLYLCHSNYPSFDSGVYSSSTVAPCILQTPLLPPTLHDDYDVSFTTGTAYSNSLFQRSVASLGSTHISSQYDDTVLYPVAAPSTIDNEAVGLVRVGLSYKFAGTAGSFNVNIRTLGFMWDRYNAGGITL